MKRKRVAPHIQSLLIGFSLFFALSSLAAQSYSSETTINKARNSQTQETVTDESQENAEQKAPEITQLVGKIENFTGPTIVVTNKDLRITPDTQFLDSEKNIISDNKFEIGEQVIVVFHPRSLQLLQMRKMGADVTTDRSNQPKKVFHKSTTPRKKSETTSDSIKKKTDIKRTNGVYTN